MSGLPLSAVLCTWLEAARAGLVPPDRAAEAVRGEDPRHLVVGWPGRDAVELHQLPGLLPAPPALALPVPGDPVGLGGPIALNAAAYDAGEAVLAGPVALVPELDARTVLWRAYAADPAPRVDERETAATLRTTLAAVTRRLVALDVAAWQPEIPDLLMDLRHRPALGLPPGMDPRRVETLERAVLCLDLVELARAGEGGAVSSYEVAQRRKALDDLDRAARHALVGACSARG